MTKTIQPRSLATLYDTGKDLTRNKQEANDNIILMRTALEDLKNLYEELSCLCDTIIKINIALTKDKGETK